MANVQIARTMKDRKEKGIGKVAGSSIFQNRKDVEVPAIKQRTAHERLGIATK